MQICSANPLLKIYIEFLIVDYRAFMLTFDKTRSFALAKRLNKQGEEMKLTNKGIVLAAAAALAVSFTGCTQQAAASTGHTKVVKAATPSDLGLYPPNAQPGHCYAKVLMPAKYATKTEKVTVDEGSARLKVIPAKYGYKTVRKLVKEPGYRLVTTPPVYKTVTERVLTKPESYRLVTVPAKYRTETRKVLVSPATTEWKRGSGVTTPIATGGHVTDVNCLVSVPAKYKTVTKRVMVTPPSTRRVPVPAQYKTITKRVLVKPAETKRIPIPAQYKTVQVKTVVEPARTVTLKTPPKYSTVTKKVKVSNAYYTWQSVQCKRVIH